ncbi:hypothetical protein [Myroides sp. WP-1]|uniref:hypothetical protein n=1 Tax=Myroides sp. WP-1 TaxID=2759944 RepID=UPI0015FA2D5A|nr:hypothetical protein [Myroides sp. WP-1]MBB1140645.1 hypothetical protein [Myroides sp. WP-1]
MKISLTLIALFIAAYTSAQTPRDTLISTIYNAYIQDESDYTVLKRNIEALKHMDNKYNPEVLNRNLEAMFQYQDLDFFKSSLELLVLHYGYNVSYLSGQENYYQAIIAGELAPWFKKMYIENHPKWLSNNLDKLVDIQTLNSLKQKDQVMTKTLMDIYNSLQLEEKKRDSILILFKQNVLENATTLISISESIGSMPTGNSFALIQKPYEIVEVHNFQQNFTTFFDMIYPFYKASYLKRDLPIVKFRNIDSIKFLADKNQIFGLISVEDIPPYLKEEYNIQRIESADPALTKKYRTELNWTEL